MFLSYYSSMLILIPVSYTHLDVYKRQELNREINTIGSKSNDIGIANLVVDVKSEIEKIREQIQNIE